VGKVLAVCWLLCLVGCGSGVSVGERQIRQLSPNGGTKDVEVVWYCDRIKPLFFYNERVAICGTKEECTKICLELRKETKQMALETLVGVNELGGFKVVVMDDLRKQYPEKFNESGAMDYKWFESEIRPANFVYVRHDKNSLSFTLQNGPIKEVGVNGCQVDTIIEAAKAIIEGLNAKFPCRENAMVITKLDEALMWSGKRKADREKRGVEGTSKA